MKIPKLTNSLFLAGLCTATASAATISNTATPIPSTDLNWDSADGSGVPVSGLVLDKFDTTLGTLTGVEFLLTSELGGTVTLARTSATGSASYGQDVFFPGIGNVPGDQVGAEFVFSSPGVSLSSTETFATGVGIDTDFTPGESPRMITVNESFSATLNPTNFSDFHDVVGGALDTFELDVSADYFEFLNLSGVTSDLDFAATAGATVTYTYDVIPEPSSILAVFCLAGGLMLRRRH